MFIEALAGATIANGVVRVEALSRTATGQDVSAGQLLIPANRLGAILASLQELADRIEKTAAEQQSVPEIAGNA